MEINNATEKKAERLSRSPPFSATGSSSLESNSIMKGQATGSGTISSGTPEAAPGSKRKIRDLPMEEPEPRRRKTGTDDLSGKAIPDIKLRQSRRSPLLIPTSPMFESAES